MFNKKEIKIFLTFFIIYSFFVYWIGWNEQSTFALTRAIVDEGRFEIDSFANQTSDRAFYNGHYYSDKDPGVSFLAVPVYATWKFIYNFFPIDFKEKYAPDNTFIETEVGENKVSIIDYINPGFFILTSMILITIFTSCLFSVLTVLLIYKISRYFTKNEKYRLLLIITAGLGTLLFPYALVFMKHAISTFFAFLAFFILFKIKHEKIKDNKYFLFSGLSLGFAITCDITTVIIGLACLVYLISFRKEKTTYFLIGGLLGILPFIVYNYLVFENPLTLSRNYMDPKIWPELGGIKGLEMSNPFVMLRLLFYPEKGIFFYYPILLIAFFGLFYMYKKFKIESILIAFIFFAFLIMNSSWWAWWGGTSFGPRHLLPSIPFLVLPLTFLFDKIDKNKIALIIVFILIFYSIFINFIGLQPIESETEEFFDIKTMTVSQNYIDKINTFQVLVNPLYSYYLSNFLTYGPRSRIFENIINSQVPIDIRYLTSYQREAFNNFYFNIPFVSLIPLIIILLLIWNKDIKNYSSKASKIKILILILIIASLFLIEFYFKIQELNKPGMQNGWYPQSPSEEGRWMRQDGIIIINNYENKTLIKKFNSLISSCFRDRKIDIFLNDNLKDTINAYRQETELNLLININPGRNIIKFHSNSYCDIPNYIENKDDTRCLSILLSNISLKTPNESLVFSNGWYPQSPSEEGRWMRQNGKIIIYNSEKLSKIFKLKILMNSYLNDRKVELLFNNEKIDTIMIYKNQQLEYAWLVNIKPGINEIAFNANQECTCPEKIEERRCLGIYMSRFDFTELNETAIFGKYWYPQSPSEEGRWMLNNGTFIIFSEKNKIAELRGFLTSFNKNIDVTAYVNGNILESFEVPTYGKEFNLTFTTLQTINSVEFYSKQDCIVPKNVKKNDDIRCLSLNIKNVSFR